MSFYISDISLFREKCNECDDAYIKRVCNRCGEGICSKSACSLDFPHYYDTIFVICHTCFNYINNKLVIHSNPDDLKLLKQKINTKLRNNKNNKNNINI